MASALQGKIKDHFISIVVLPEFIQSTVFHCVPISITDSIHSLKAISCSGLSQSMSVCKKEYAALETSHPGASQVTLTAVTADLISSSG